jgi:hypothetical protein
MKSHLCNSNMAGHSRFVLLVCEQERIVRELDNSLCIKLIGTVLILYSAVWLSVEIWLNDWHSDNHSISPAAERTNKAECRIIDRVGTESSIAPINR